LNFRKKTRKENSKPIFAMIKWNNQKQEPSIFVKTLS